MNSRTTERFRKSFKNLPPRVKEEANKVFKAWKENPYNKSLKFKKIHNKENIFSVRIGLSWRALGILENDLMIWFWIGSHSEYDKMIKNL